MSSQIAAQMYTLRDFTKTSKDIAITLARVKKMGYDAVQLSALGKIDAAENAKMLENEGLVCCATHVSLERMRDETAAVIDEHHLWLLPIHRHRRLLPQKTRRQRLARFRPLLQRNGRKISQLRPPHRLPQPQP